MKKRTLSVFTVFVLLSMMPFACLTREPGPADNKRLNVVTTLFPLYDFAKNVGGMLVEVELLVPPGMEPHSYEPNPGDILKINDSDIFLYTGEYMEPWVEDILKSLSREGPLVVDTSTGIVIPEDYAQNNRDPHIWLDFSNAQTMVENILNSFIVKDPANRNVYLKNAGAYAVQLGLLDKRFHDELSLCRKDMIIHGGHFAFGYLTRRYHLRYLSAYRGFSPNAEPTPGNMIELIQNLRNHGLNHVFFEELVSPNVAETVARETGARLLMLHGAHNISKKDWDQKVTFLSLMENNLENLKIALECR